MFKAVLILVLICLGLALPGNSTATASIRVTAFVEYPIGYLQVEHVKSAVNFDIIRPKQHEKNWIVYEESILSSDHSPKETESESGPRDFIITIINFAD